MTALRAAQLKTLDSGSSPEWRLSVSAAKPIPAATAALRHESGGPPTATPRQPESSVFHLKTPFTVQQSCGVEAGIIGGEV